MELVTQLVTLEDAKRQLRITAASAEIDTDVDQKLAQATSLVLAMVHPAPLAPWDDSTVPPEVHTAILWTLDVLYVRPEDLNPHMQAMSGYLMASGFRDPAVA